MVVVFSFSPSSGLAIQSSISLPERRALDTFFTGPMSHCAKVSAARSPARAVEDLRWLAASDQARHRLRH